MARVASTDGKSGFADVYVDDVCMNDLLPPPLYTLVLKR